MYEEIKGIDYVLYINRYDNMVHLLDLIDNKDKTVQNDGSSWNEAAYGNCLILLRYAKSTDALYLLTKQAAASLNRVSAKNIAEVKEVLENNATKIIRR